MRGVVALDVGRSAVKCVADGLFKQANGQFERARVSFVSPAVAFPAISIGDEAESDRSRNETVIFNGEPWFFGKTAEIQSVGNHSVGFSSSWFESKEHSVLFLGAVKRLQDMGMKDVTKALFVLGLPTNQHLAGKSKLKVLMGRFYPEIEILVASQPSGALHCDILAENGMENPGRSLSTESVAVLDIGCATTDSILYQDGKWVEHGAHTMPGVKVAAEKLSKLIAEKHGVEVGLGESQEILITKQLLNFGAIVDVSGEVQVAKDVLANLISEEANRLFSPVARKLKKIIVAGGGAPLVFDQLKATWPHVVMLPNHRLSIADGFCRLGLRILMARSITGRG